VQVSIRQGEREREIERSSKRSRDRDDSRRARGSISDFVRVLCLLRSIERLLLQKVVIGLRVMALSGSCNERMIHGRDLMCSVNELLARIIRERLIMSPWIVCARTLSEARVYKVTGPTLNEIVGHVRSARISTAIVLTWVLWA
jgi:hypothetical protein